MPDKPSPPQAAPSRERRASARHLCPHGAVIPYLLKPDYDRGEAVLRDLSTDGMCLLLGHPLNVGAMLVVRLPGLLPGATVTRVAHVTHATPQEGGGWLIGCRLAHSLSDSQIRRALQGE